MYDGCSFAGEGDWKTAALVRDTKVMATGGVKLSYGRLYVSAYEPARAGFICWKYAPQHCGR